MNRILTLLLISMFVSCNYNQRSVDSNSKYYLNSKVDSILKVIPNNDDFYSIVTINDINVDSKNNPINGKSYSLYSVLNDLKNPKPDLLYDFKISDSLIIEYFIDPSGDTLFSRNQDNYFNSQIFQKVSNPNDYFEFLKNIKYDSLYSINSKITKDSKILTISKEDSIIFKFNLILNNEILERVDLYSGNKIVEQWFFNKNGLISKHLELDSENIKFLKFYIYNTIK